MLYYGVQDIMEFTNTKENKSYEIIRELNKKYKKKFPDCELIQGQVPKWFFEEAMGFKNQNNEEEVRTS